MQVRIYYKDILLLKYVNSYRMAKMENNYKIVLQIGFRGHNFLQYPEQSNCNVTDWKHRGHGSHSHTDWLKKSEGIKSL